MLKDRPPRLGEWLLKRFLLADECYEKLGDFEEGYHIKAREKGKHKAFAWYWLQLILTIPVFVNNLFYWRFIMFKNYLKTALRNIKRNKGYSFINIFGFVTGLTAALLILLYIQFELSFDKFHVNADRIFRIIEENVESGNRFPTTPAPLAPAIVEGFPDVINAARLEQENEVLISYGNRNFLEKNIYFADPSIFEIFSFELLKGDPATAMANPYSIILSEDMKTKYFGDDNPIGKTIVYRDAYDFIVTGILKKVPENSHFKIDFIVPFQTIVSINPWMSRAIQEWRRSGGFTYILMKEGSNPLDLEKKFSVLIEKHLGKNMAAQILWKTEPLKKIHLNWDIDVKTIILFSTIAILILLIACINYMNLATARSSLRIQEIGIRKVVGANRTQLVQQILGESMISTILAFIFAVILARIFLPSFSIIVGRNINLNLIENYQSLIWLFSLILLVGMIAGSYPALIISSISSTALFSGRVGKTKKSILRGTLVTVQFTISLTLIISTLIVRKQMNYIKNEDISQNKDQILVVNVQDEKIQNNLSTILAELNRNPNITSVTSSSALPNNTTTRFGLRFPGMEKDKRVLLFFNTVNYDFIKTYDIQILEGRAFSRDFPADTQGAFIFNETALKTIGWESALNQEISYRVPGGERKGRIVGIMKDFNMRSFHHPIEPLCFELSEKDSSRFLSIKINGDEISKTLRYVKETVKNFSPNYPFTYTFFDDIFDTTYKSELKQGILFRVFASIALALACLGLFGLAANTAVQRTKEIGIRKVLGASALGIMFLLTRKFTKWIALANIIAWPIVYIAMNQWLQRFAYRIDIDLFPFIWSALFALMIAFLSVGYQAAKVALANPVDALRYE